MRAPMLVLVLSSAILCTYAAVAPAQSNRPTEAASEVPAPSANLYLFFSVGASDIRDLWQGTAPDVTLDGEPLGEIPSHGYLQASVTPAAHNILVSSPRFIQPLVRGYVRPITAHLEAQPGKRYFFAIEGRPVVIPSSPVGSGIAFSPFNAVTTVYVPALLQVTESAPPLPSSD